MRLTTGTNTRSNPRKRRIAKRLVAATAALGFSALGVWGTTGSAAVAADQASVSESVPRVPAKQAGDVTIADNAFSPAVLEVTVGTVVTWTNQDSEPHTVTSQGEGPMNSGELGRGQAYSQTFTEPGTYTYHCTLHPGMHGEIVVRPR
ncbi:cupredoxin domain-containing protein [Streptomyces sannanensis]